VKHDEHRPAIRPVALKRKLLERYRAIVGDEAVEEIRDLARELRGLRVLELSATATGGGVAEMLGSLVPLERDLGLDARWSVIAGDAQFFEVTKKLHNGMQGMEVELTPEDQREYLHHNERYARVFQDSWDAVIVHDPQPAALRSFLPREHGCWIWRCHVDSSTPHLPVWESCAPTSSATTMPSSRWSSSSRRTSASRRRCSSRRSTRCPRRTARCRATWRARRSRSSASTSRGRCCCRSRASTRGRTRSA